MVKKEILKEIIVNFHKSKTIDPVKRNIEIPVDLGKIITLIGVRRSGKTYLLFDTINHLVSLGIKKENILYINFEDERLQLETSELDLILQAWRELYPESKENELYIFFDEIQNLNGWEKFIRRIYDTITKNIFITGSNSSFLSTDIATSLRGRSIQFEIFPYSFNEYLRHLTIEPEYYSSGNKALILNKLKHYLHYGGFPETVNADENMHNEIMRSYFYVMIYKDLIERYKITSINVLKYFIEKIADNLTKPFSINKIYNELRSQGFKLDKNLLYDLLRYSENIYMSFNISKYDRSLSKRMRSDKKVYFIDNGLANALSANISNDWGKMLENTIFLFLRSNYGDLFNNNIFYHKNGKECDFIVTDRQKILSTIQVSYDITSEETLKREITGLLNALKFHNLKSGIIITFEEENEITINDKFIRIMPAYKILTNNKIDL